MSGWCWGDLGLLQVLEVFADFGVGPVCRADEFTPDDAVAIDQVRLQKPAHVGVKQAGGCFVRIAHGNQVYVAIANRSRLY